MPKKPTNPGLTPDQISTIQELAPSARMYRARLAENHPSTVNNRTLTDLCITLHNQGVPLQELADAAGVTYRAMYRRVRNGR